MSRQEGGGGPIEGIRPVIEAIRAGRRRVYEVELPPHRSTPGLRELELLLEECRIPVRRSADHSGGIRASAEPFPEEPFEALLDESSPRLLVALDRVTNVGNLGAIARSSDAAGATGLVLEQRHAPAIGPGALRASAGALEFLRVGRTPNLKNALELSVQEGLQVLVADPTGTPLVESGEDFLTRELIWVFGSEDRGVRPSILELSSRVVAIPTRGHIASLGVAAAAAHLLLRTAEARAAAGPVRWKL